MSQASKTGQYPIAGLNLLLHHAEQPKLTRVDAGLGVGGLLPAVGARQRHADEVRELRGREPEARADRADLGARHGSTASAQRFHSIPISRNILP